MPLLDLDKLTADLSHTWAGFLRDWDRSLRSANYPEVTKPTSSHFQAWMTVTRSAAQR